MKLFDRRSLRFAAAMFAATTVALASCDSAIYDDEGDCSVRYHVGFRYKKNVLDVDAFASQVKSVSLFVFDRNGTLVATKTESGEALAREGYSMQVDVAPGRYDLVAWCGLTESEAFSLVGGARPARKEDLACRLARVTPDGATAARRDKPLDALFHGYAENVEFPDTYGDHVAGVVDLTKNTNTVRVILQHYNGRELDKDDFSFTVTDDNGLMNYDNTLLDDEIIVYGECKKQSGEVSLPDGSRTVTSISSVIAQIDLARLVKEGHAPELTVACKDKSEPLFRLPLIDLLLCAKGDVPYAKEDQDYLDRQDNYNLIFFIDDENGWYAKGGIWINSWHVMRQSSDL